MCRDTGKLKIRYHVTCITIHLRSDCQNFAETSNVKPELYNLFASVTQVTVCGIRKLSPFTKFIHGNPICQYL
jgi:hypothetical protein